MTEEFQACKRLGGIVKNNVCFIDNFPTHARYKDWWGETIISEALKYKKAIVIHTSPEDGKKLFPPTSFEESTIKKLMDRIKKKKPINPPWIELCLNIESKRPGFKYTWIAGHEGRHRIEASRRAGIKKIPIVFRIKPEYACRQWKIET
ncbi:MAG: ParB/Srx family N-terminal domain-containing protein [Candidatus Aenigmatarchaeota archaeon]